MAMPPVSDEAASLPWKIRDVWLSAERTVVACAKQSPKSVLTKYREVCGELHALLRDEGSPVDVRLTVNDLLAVLAHTVEIDTDIAQSVMSSSAKKPAKHKTAARADVIRLDSVRSDADATNDRPLFCPCRDGRHQDAG